MMRARHRSIDVFTKESIFVSPKSKRTRKSSFLRFGFLLLPASLSFLLFFFLFHKRSRRESFQGRRVEFDAFGGVLAIVFAREVRHFRVSYPNGGPTSTTRESSF